MKKYQCSKASDVYSLAMVILYIILPFEVFDADRRIERKTRNIIHYLKKKNTFDPDFINMLIKMISINPKDRPTIDEAIECFKKSSQ